jgi:hypothetical protein
MIHAFSAPLRSQTPRAIIKAPQSAINYTPMENEVINQDTGASLEYRQRI